jgi:hypothetical protein
MFRFDIALLILLLPVRGLALSGDRRFTKPLASRIDVGTDADSIQEPHSRSKWNWNGSSAFISFAG